MAKKQVAPTQADYDTVKTHNDLKKGMHVFYMRRECEVIQARKGIRKMLKVPTLGGQGDDIGDVYVWQISHVVMPDGTHKRIELSPAHAKQKAEINAFGW